MTDSFLLDKQISTTVYPKTGTKVSKHTLIYPYKSTCTVIDYGERTPMKQMGIDKVGITRNSKGKITNIELFQRIGDSLKKFCFEPGSAELKTYIAVLKKAFLR